MGIRLARVTPQKKASSDREKPHKYVCPICGQEVKSAADFKINCTIRDIGKEKVN